ncbi:MAG: hypothetical protein ACXVPN_07550 [Bacteroidia bacterium]
MIFLTFNDNFSGIYKSQVIDVCDALNKKFHLHIKLVAFVSLRNYSKQKQLIRFNYDNAIVLPMFPKVQFWKMNKIILFFVCLFGGNKKIWARGPFACNLALSMKSTGLVKKVLFDARGAYRAELTEYNVVQNETVKNNISSIEKKALEKSDGQLAVSHKLIDWWKEQYNFIPKIAAQIPCTISTHFNTPFPVENEVEHARKTIGFSRQDVVLVYSGTSAGWQSFAMVDEYLFKQFSANSHLKLLFLSDETPKNSKLFAQFKDRIITKWVKPEEVRSLLITADYGLLIREDSVTNKVASPVKFAEYLSCGLQVIISENIGDFTEFTIKNNCGFLFSGNNEFKHVPYPQKQNNHQLAIQHFTKESPEIIQGYEKLFSA